MFWYSEVKNMKIYFPTICFGFRLVKDILLHIFLFSLNCVLVFKSFLDGHLILHVYTVKKLS